MKRLKIFRSHQKDCIVPYGDQDQYSEMVKCPYCGRYVKETNLFYVNDIGDVGELDYVCEKHGVVGYFKYGYTSFAPTTIEEYITIPLHNLWMMICMWFERKFAKNDGSQLTDTDLPF